MPVASGTARTQFSHLALFTQRYGSFAGKSEAVVFIHTITMDGHYTLTRTLDGHYAGTRTLDGHFSLTRTLDGHAED